MDGDTFRRCAGETADFIVNYIKRVKDRRVIPSVEPGYLHQLLPRDAPQQPDAWEDIMKDMENKILPGLTHWRHPHFHAYFPGGGSYPSMLGELLTAGLGSISFSWISSPAMTELETVMVDWVGRMMDLPKELLPYTDGCTGGGIIQGSSSECTLVCMFAARTKTINSLKEEYPGEDDCILLSKLVAYFSEEAHSSVEKAANISFVKRRKLPTDAKFALRGETLRKAVEEDVANGLVPFFVCATIGTTSSTAIDNIEEIGQVCGERDLWLHVDGAYGGNALICPEFKYLLRGFEYVTSFNYNPVKWMLTSLSCSVMWVRDKYAILEALSISRIYYLAGDDKHMIDYRNWTIPLSRRFRALKLWFVIRMHGVEGLQEHIRSHVKLAKSFESWVRADDRFEVVGDVVFGLVCFRLKGENKMTESLLQRINESGKAHMIPTDLHGKFVIRFTPGNWYYSEEIIKESWSIITSFADVVIRKHQEIVKKFQGLLAKYRDKARALQESRDDDVVEDSQYEVLYELGFSKKKSMSLGEEHQPGNECKTKRKTSKAFISLSIQDNDSVPDRIRKPSATQFS